MRVSDATNAVRTVANYSCNEGFIIDGASQRICLDTQMWSGEAPNCTQGSNIGMLIKLISHVFSTVTIYVNEAPVSEFFCALAQ